METHPVVAIIDVQAEDKCFILSAEDGVITLTKEESSNLSQDTSSGDESGDEWHQPHLEALWVEPFLYHKSVTSMQVLVNDKRNTNFLVKIAGINATVYMILELTWVA